MRSAAEVLPAYEEQLIHVVKTFSTQATYSLSPINECEPISYRDLPSFVVPVPPRRLIPDIAAAVLGEHPGVSMRHVFGKDRHANIVKARHHIWHQIKQERFDISIAEIGRRFKTDHHTVLYGIRRHEERMARAKRQASG